MNGMKRKIVITGSVVLIVAFVALVVVLMREPAQAADPSKDYSKAAKPSSQVLSATASQPAAADAKQSALATTTEPTTAATPATASVTTPAAQSTASTPTTTKPDTDSPVQVTPAKLGPVDALLQVIHSLGL